MENDSLNYEIDFLNSEDIEDISDVYSDEVINEILDDAAADRLGDASPAVSTVYDDTDLRLQIDEFTDSFTEFSDSVSDKLDKMTSINIAILVILTGFVAISIFRKLFDWIG